MNQQSIDDVLTLVRKMIRPGANSEKGENRKQFVQSAINLVKKHFEELGKVIVECQHAQIQENGHETAKEACVSHASWSESLEFLNQGKSPWTMQRYYQNKEKEVTKTLQEAVSTYGLDLAEVCLQFQDSEPCKMFVSETYKKLLNYGMVDHVLKLLMQTNHGSMQTDIIGNLMKTLAKTNQWEKGVQSIVSILNKKNPKLDIQGAGVAFLQQLLQSNKAYLAIDLIELSDNDSNLCSQILNKSFAVQEEDYLYKIYLTAKAWIQKDPSKYAKDLVFVIKKFFELGCQKSWCNSAERMNQEMARSLATKWLQTVQPQWIDRNSLDSSLPWSIAHRPGSSYHEKYSSKFNKDNWKQLFMNEGVQLP